MVTPLLDLMTFLASGKGILPISSIQAKTWTCRSAPNLTLFTKHEKKKNWQIYWPKKAWTRREIGSFSLPFLTHQSQPPPSFAGTTPLWRALCRSFGWPGGDWKNHRIGPNNSNNECLQLQVKRHFSKLDMKWHMDHMDCTTNWDRPQNLKFMMVFKLHPWKFLDQFIARVFRPLPIYLSPPSGPRIRPWDSASYLVPQPWICFPGTWNNKPKHPNLCWFI